MANEIVPVDMPVSVGVADIPAKSVGRGTISVGDYVSFVGEDGMEQFGTVAGLVPSESGWLLQVVLDGGDVPMDLAVGDVKKAKRPVGDGAMTEPAALVESEMSSEVAEFGDPIRVEGGRFAGSEPGPLQAGDKAEGLGPPTVTADNLQAEVVGVVIATGRLPMSGDPEIGGGEAEINAFDDMLTPAAAAVTLTAVVPAEAIDVGALVAGGQMPTFELGYDTMVVGGGDAREVGRWEDRGARTDRPQDLVPAVSGNDVVLQVSVPEGHPVVNLGTSETNESSIQSSNGGPAKSPMTGGSLSAYGSTSAIMSPETQYEVTGAGYNPVTGQLVVTANASLPGGAA